MKLLEITDANFKEVLTLHDDDGGNSINASLLKLFKHLDDESSKEEVSIKVAALNQLYSTAIQYIKPVVEKIVNEAGKNESNFIELVDKIATVTWVNPTKKESYTRCNLSFASKYVHFLSNCEIPIYDSYIWIVMIGYLNQNGKSAYIFKAPANYRNFYNVFTEFKNEFNLKNYSNYEIDKFLWQYGKNTINKIMNEESVNLDKAKSLLKQRITLHLS
jgi:hypothetical protein